MGLQRPAVNIVETVSMYVNSNAAQFPLEMAIYENIQILWWRPPFGYYINNSVFTIVGAVLGVCSTILVLVTPVYSL
jgi:hypothetical protein